MMNNITIDLYPMHGGHMAKILIPDDQIFKQNIGTCRTYVILDRSGSMGYSIKKIVNDYLPSAFEKIGYCDEKITVIMFDDELEIFESNVKLMRERSVNSGGTTYMSNAVKKLGEFIEPLKNEKIRILSLSDGDLHDKLDTVFESSKVANKISQDNSINSQAIRFFTSDNQPDTRGLASVLQFNNVKETKLKDIPSHSDRNSIINQIVELFENDGLSQSVKLISQKNNIMITPWSLPIETINLKIGENILWFNELPSESDLNIDQINVNWKVNTHIESNEVLMKLISDKMKFFLDKIKILKVVNTPETQAEISQMMKYFDGLQAWMDARQVDMINLSNNPSLRSRMVYFKKVLDNRRTNIIHLMSQIANDNRVSQLNSAQQAAYLRNIEVNKQTKSLARRTIESNIDFDSVARNEVKKMHANLSELNNISENAEYTSFYSQDTTLGGIKSVCSLVDENMIDAVTALDIIQMINIVGVAVNANIGDYADPMTWKVNKIFPGCYISVSDIVTAYIHSNGQKLHPPGYEHHVNNEITSVIPISNDSRIVEFMKKYCPSILEYSSSIGMRRLIVDVNLTHRFTILSGIVKLVQEINDDKSSLKIETFIKLIKNLEALMGQSYNFAMNIDQNSDLTCYIENNGYSNLIYPLYQLIKKGDFSSIPKILRSIYSFEAYQIMRTVSRKNGNEVRHEYINQLLHQILGIDFKTYGTVLTPEFESNPDPVYHNQYHLKLDLMNQLTYHFKQIDYLTLLPLLLSAIGDDSIEIIIDKIKKIPKMNEESILSSLEISYDLSKFKFYTLIQSLIYSENSKRADDDNKVMKIIDLDNENKVNYLIKKFIKNVYKDEYNSRCIHKTKNEVTVVMNVLVDRLINCQTLEEFCTLLKNQFVYRNVAHQIINTTSFGFINLKDKLIDINIHVPLRQEKLHVLIIGSNYDGEVIWNNGNRFRVKIEEYKHLFDEYHYEKILAEYKARGLHIYRELENRHGHSNTKPSYWGLGYDSIESMIECISEEEWMEYKSIHVGCCGLGK